MSHHQTINDQAAPPLQQGIWHALYVDWCIYVYEVERGPHHISIYSSTTKHCKILFNFIIAIVLISGHQCWINHLYNMEKTVWLIPCLIFFI